MSERQVVKRTTGHGLSRQGRTIDFVDSQEGTVLSGAVDSQEEAVASDVVDSQEEAVASDVDAEISRRLVELARDETAATTRIAVCDAISEALSHLGRVFWAAGAIVRQNIDSGASPSGFDVDAAAGVAAIIQMGGALARGAI